eukprot:COSAG02_NODE_48473_length_333_cov_1.089744_1_plen_28_part_01
MHEIFHSFARTIRYWYWYSEIMFIKHES